MTFSTQPGVIDYGGGNIRSLIRALEKLGAPPRLVTAPEELDGLEVLFFPGQGAFGDCMKKLNALNLTEGLVDWIRADKPFFGICVGYQLLFESSQESPGVTGLSVFEGEVTRFPESDLKVPHMGWNSAHVLEGGASPWQNLGSDPFFYYVHSYFPSPVDRTLVAAETTYGVPFAGAVQRGRLVATQFHPEKSQKAGLRLIGNFLEEHAS